MRVIEAIVKTVPREDIDPLAEFFTQDYDGEIYGYENAPTEDNYSGFVWRGEAGESYYVGESQTASDARTVIIAREELMKAYDLVEQGYTLWFGGDCPVGDNELVDVVEKRGASYSHTIAMNGYWGINTEVIAYRLSESGDKSPSLYPLSEEKVKVIQSVIANNHTKNWSYHPDSILVNKETGKFCSGADSLVIITKDEWNTYLDSVKIEVGDTVSFIHSDVFYEVLYVGKEKAFIKDSEGTEYSFPLEELSKVVK